jgi:ribosome-associated protein
VAEGRRDIEEVAVTGPLPLGAFLKLAGVASTGGHAKILIQTGAVVVNGDIETRRGRTLAPGDIVGVGGREYRVWSSPA